MKYFLKSVFKVLLFCLLIVLTCFGVFYLTKQMGWSYWVAGIILSALAAIVAGVWLCIRYFRRYKEKKFVERVIKQDKERIIQAREAHHKRLDALRHRWMNAIHAIKMSSLKLYGNPIYVLPWYMVFGDTGSGKSALISHCGLNAAYTDLGPQAGETNTKNCNWWFFEEAIVLDTAGRYAVPLDANTDELEWQEFLTYLARYRRKEPLNGVIITLAADKLLEGDADYLKHYGKRIGRQINQLIQVISAQIPIYLMISKADQIRGFYEFSQNLTPEQRMVPFGFTESDTKAHALDVGNRAIKNIVQQLQDFMLHADNANQANTLILTEQIQSIKEALNIFIENAFSHDHYYEPVILRGVYLSSAIQSGSSTSQLLGAKVAHQYKDNDEVEKSGQEGFFLTELFAKVLPQDRNLYRPTHTLRRWQMITSGLTLSVITLVGAAILGILGIEYLHGRNTIADLELRLREVVSVSGHYDAEVLALDRLRRKLAEVEKNDQWWKDYLPLHGISQRLVNQSRTLYINYFNRLVLPKLESTLVDWRYDFSDLKLQNDYGDRLSYLTWWLLTAQAASSHSHFPPLVSENVTWDADSWRVVGMKPLLQPYLLRMIRAYLFWIPEGQRAAIRRLFEHNLDKLLYAQGNWNWLIDWVSRSSRVPMVLASSYWQVPLAEDVGVKGAYTETGRKEITDLLKLVHDFSAYSQTKERIVEFWHSYGAAFKHDWLSFLMEFPKTAKGLTEEKAMEVAVNINNPDNPFLEVQSSVIRALTLNKDLVPVDLSSMKLARSVIKIGQKSDGVSKTFSTKMSSLFSASKDGKAGERLKNGIKLYKGLAGSLHDLQAVLQNHQAAAQNFSSLLQNPSSASPESKGGTFVDQLLAQFETKEPALNGAQVFSNMYDFMVNQEALKTSCWLQKQWSDLVSAQLQQDPDIQENMQLFAPKQGPFDKYVEGPLHTYVIRQGAYWTPASFRKFAVPFKPSFLKFISLATDIKRYYKPHYGLKIRVLPVETNDSAMQRSDSLTLSMQCTGQTQQVTNYNFPVSKEFSWNPQECSSMDLLIQFKGVTLEKNYTGISGFVTFLQDFERRFKVLRPSDFPGKESLMKQMNVQWLKLSLNINGNEALDKQITGRALQIPSEVGLCYSSNR